jgi:hypothetical protein
VWAKMGGAGYKLCEQSVEVMKWNLNGSRVHDATEELPAYHHRCVFALEVRRLRMHNVNKGRGSEPSANR